MVAVWAILSTPFWLFFLFWTFLGCFANDITIKGKQVYGWERIAMRLIALIIGFVCALIALWMDGAFA
jgi:hypothetical protein